MKMLPGHSVALGTQSQGTVLQGTHSQGNVLQGTQSQGTAPFQVQKGFPIPNIRGRKNCSESQVAVLVVGHVEISILYIHNPFCDV
jgi:hypothetical protein